MIKKNNLSTASSIMHFFLDTKEIKWPTKCSYHLKGCLPVSARRTIANIGKLIGKVPNYNKRTILQYACDPLVAEIWTILRGKIDVRRSRDKYFFLIVKMQLKEKR